MNKIVRKRLKDSSKSKSCACVYKIKVNQDEKAVCKKAFCSLFGINKSRVDRIIKPLQHNIPSPEDKRGKHTNRRNSKGEKTVFQLETRIRSFPDRSIHLISADPFMVHYWSPYQMAVYKETLKLSKNRLRLCIDATGGLVKKIKRTTQDVTSAHIFLYVIVLHDGIIQVPVCQMLSEIQDIPSISYWLSEWVRAGAPSPSEVVVDYSNALFGAVTRTFTSLTKYEYCEKSFRILKNNSNDPNN